MADEIKVGMADMKVGKENDKLITYGLGSCVGLMLYDEVNRVGGLAHIMLPNSNQRTNSVANRAKFADTAVIELIEKLIDQGASKNRLRAKIAGGAEMFSFSKSDSKASIGNRNVEAVKKFLKNEGIGIVGEDTGKDYGRTVELETATGKVKIKTIGSGVLEI